MNGVFLLQWLMRWLHIVGACILVGSPIFMRFFLEPAMAQMDPSVRDAMQERMMRGWRRFLGVVILTQIVSGLYWLFAVVNIAHQPPLYQMLLGIKMLAALVLFFLLSVLAGRAKAFEIFRQQSRKWLAIAVIVALVTVLCADAMRITGAQHRNATDLGHITLAHTPAVAK